MSFDAGASPTRAGYRRSLGMRTKFSGWRRLATEMSSSRASQWIPIPPPINSHSARCFGVASRRRGNQARGTETVRPSARTTVNVSAVQTTSIARASALFGKVLIPFLHEKLFILDNQPSNLGNLVTSKTTHIRQSHGLKPELGIPTSMGHMNMSRFSSLHAEEEKPVSTDPQQRRHEASLT
jgi:hypothetical protein